MKKGIIYVHGKGGNAEESNRYKTLFADCDVLGFDYNSLTPWQAQSEFSDYFDKVSKGYDEIEMIANSIGAYFTMVALFDKDISKAYFISPIVDMEKLIENMMIRANVTEKELELKKEIPTAVETLSWKYLCFVRNNPIKWNTPTHILYGEFDNLTSFETINEFAKRTNATLTVMKGGEHWFHTDEQTEFLDNWIKKYNRIGQD